MDQSCGAMTATMVATPHGVTTVTTTTSTITTTTTTTPYGMTIATVTPHVAS